MKALALIALALALEGGFLLSAVAGPGCVAGAPAEVARARPAAPDCGPAGASPRVSAAGAGPVTVACAPGVGASAR